MGFPLVFIMQKTGMEIIHSAKSYQEQNLISEITLHRITEKYEEMMNEYFNFADIYKARDGWDKTLEYFRKKLDEFQRYVNIFLGLN